MAKNEAKNVAFSDVTYFEQKMVDFEMQVDMNNPANLDIESHLHNYKGNILIQRLQFIIEKSDLYRIDALRNGVVFLLKIFKTM